MNEKATFQSSKSKMFSSKFLQASKSLMARGIFKNATSLRYMSVANSDVEQCAGYGTKPLSKCMKKVATGCRDPNASVKCVSLSTEVPCEKIKPPCSSFLEMLQAQDVFKLQKSCPNECCCLQLLSSTKKPVKISFEDLNQIETRC